MRGSLPGEMSGWHLEIVEVYCRLYLIIWRRKSRKTRGTRQMEHSHCGSQEGKGPHFPQKSRCYGVEIAFFKYLSSPANPTKACDFLPSLPAGGTVPLSWMSTAPFLCSGASSVPPPNHSLFFVSCTFTQFLSLASAFPYIKYTHVSHLGKRSFTGHTFNNINRWCRVSLKFHHTAASTEVRKVCVCVCFN